MPRKTTECPTCGASLPILKGETLFCPECGMPIESPEFEEIEPVEEEEEEEETESEVDWE